MESGFYRAADPTVSTQDWFRLNFDSYRTSIFEALAEHDPSILEDLIRVDVGEEPEEPEMPEEPDEDDPKYENDPDFLRMDREAWERDCEKLQEEYEEAYEEWESSQQLAAWPTAWGAVWAAKADATLQEALIESGFVVYETHGLMEDFGDLVFGVDGGGYSFYAAHWIPLRARLAREQFERGYVNAEEFARVLFNMSHHQAREGGVVWTEFFTRYAGERDAELRDLLTKTE